MIAFVKGDNSVFYARVSIIVIKEYEALKKINKTLNLLNVCVCFGSTTIVFKLQNNFYC